MIVIHRFYLTLLIFFLLTINGFCQTSDTTLNKFERYWEISPDVYRVMRDGEFGVLANNKLVIPCEFQQVWNLVDEGYFRVMKNGKTGVYHLDKGIIIPPEYDQIWDFKNDKARVTKNGKVGYFGRSGEVIIPCKYQQIWDFRDGRARVLRDGKIGYIDENGVEIIPCKYQEIDRFDNGKAKVIRDGKIGLIDESGNEIIPCEYQKIMPFENNRAKVVKDGYVGFIDTLGQSVIPPIFTKIWDFERDSAKAILDGDIVYIDNFGKVLSVEYKNAEPADQENTSMNSETTFRKDTSVVIELGKKKLQIDKNDDAFTVKILPDLKKKNKPRNFKGHLWGVDLGYNSYLNDQGGSELPTGYDFLSLDGRKSIEVNINFFQQSANLIPSGNMGIVTGLGLQLNNYRFDHNNLLIVDENNNIASTPSDKELLKNKLSTVYLNVPLLLEIQAKPNNGYHTAYLSGGVVGGLRLKSYTKIVSNESGSKSKDKTRDNFNLQDLRYGLMIRAGYRFINLYGTYYFSTLFDNKNDPELHPFSIGLSFYPDWLN